MNMSRCEESGNTLTSDANEASFARAMASLDKGCRVELQVRLPAGVKLKVKLREDATVAELKTAVEKCCGIPSDLHYISYQNEPLKNEIRIGDLLSPKDDMVNFVLSVPNWWNKIVCSSMKGEIEQTCARMSVKMNQITRDERQFVAAFIGASRGNHSLLFSLTAGKKQLDIHQTVKHSGRSLLHAAVAGGDLSCVVNVLVNGGVFLIKQPDKNGETPFQIAEKLKNEGILQLLEKYLEMHERENNELDKNNFLDLGEEDSGSLEVVLPHDSIKKSPEESDIMDSSLAVSTAEFSKNKITDLMKSKWKKRKLKNINCDVAEKTDTNEFNCADVEFDTVPFPEHTQADVSHTDKDHTDTSVQREILSDDINEEFIKECDFSETSGENVKTALTDNDSAECQTQKNKLNVRDVENYGSTDSWPSEDSQGLSMCHCRPRSSSEPPYFQLDEEEIIPSLSEVDNNLSLHVIETKVTKEDVPLEYEKTSATESNRQLNRECLCHPTLKPEKDGVLLSEEKNIVIESVIELAEKEKLPRSNMAQYKTGEANTSEFPPLHTHDVKSHNKVSPTLSLSGKNNGRHQLHERLARNHSGPRRVLSLKTTRDSSSLHKVLPSPHPPLRQTKSAALHSVAKPDGPKITQKESSSDHLFHLMPQFTAEQPKSAPTSPERQRRNRTGSLPFSNLNQHSYAGGTRPSRAESLHPSNEKHHGLLMDIQVQNYLLSKYKERKNLPWNQWKAVERRHDNHDDSTGNSVEEYNQDCDDQHTGSSAGQRFDEWLAKKEADFQKRRALIEEETKRTEKIKKVEENFRRLTHMTHEEWMEEKKIKEKKMLERNLELTRQNSDKKERPKKAERKFEEWLLQKAEEELKEEERLRKAMEKKFEEHKKKKESPVVSKVKLSRTHSLPLDSKRPAKHSAVATSNAYAQNAD